MMQFHDLSVFFWNVRDFASRRSHHRMRDILVCYKPGVVVICETHTLFALTAKFWEKEDYIVIGIEETHGHSGGLWVFEGRLHAWRFE